MCFAQSCPAHRIQDIQEDPRQEVCMKMLDDLAQQLAACPGSC